MQNNERHDEYDFDNKSPNPEQYENTQTPKPQYQNELPESDEGVVDALFVIWLVMLIVIIIVYVSAVVLTVCRLSVPSMSDALWTLREYAYGLFIILGKLPAIAVAVIAFVAKIKYPKEKKSNVMFWVTVAVVAIAILLSVLAMILITAACNAMCDG